VPQSLLDGIGSIVSAACLAHDLGNPPFGHSGEKAISRYFSEIDTNNIRELLTASHFKIL
jgi:dGTPase